MGTGVLAVRETVWDALSQRDETVIETIGVLLDLGEPATHVEPPAERWNVFADGRFDLEDVAYFGCLFNNVALLGVYVPPTDGEGRKDRAQLRADQRDFCERQFPPARRVVWPIPIAEDDPNPWQSVLSAQGLVTANVQMFPTTPAGWVPAELT